MPSWKRGAKNTFLILAEEEYKTLATTKEALDKHGYQHLTVLARGESDAEEFTYGRNRIEASAHARKKPHAPGTPGTSGKFPLPVGISPTPNHDLVNNGGKTISALNYKNIYVAGDTAWSAGDKQSIDTALLAIMTDPKLTGIIQQYFPGSVISNTFNGSVNLAIPVPATVSRGDIDHLLQQALSAGLIIGDFETTVFNFLLPPGTVLTDAAAPGGGAIHDAAATTHSKRGHAEDKASSLGGLGGYHGSVHLGGQRYYFAVGVYSQILANGQENGIVAFNLPWKNVTATFYHEMQEVRTDADVEDVNNQLPGAAIGWISASGEEIGDFPVFEDPNLHSVFVEITLTAGGTAPVQLIYSNRAHGPEVPA